MNKMALFAAMFVTLYAAHHVGDYWVQTDTQTRHKGDAGLSGAMACAEHAVTYALTQWIFAVIACTMLGWPSGAWRGFVFGLVASGVTHYFIDRREHGVMFWLARRIPGKAAFLKLGVPRKPAVLWRDAGTNVEEVCTDNPCLGTGAWALDQSAHIVFSVFVPALLMAVVR